MTITAAAETRTKEQEKYQEHVIVTKCPAEPCAILYTDTLSNSILIECRDARHATLDENQGEAGREGEATTATHLSQTNTGHDRSHQEQQRRSGVI